MTNLNSFINRLISVVDLSMPSLTYAIKQEEIDEVILMATHDVLEQATMIEVKAPIAICGDIHGQYTDLLRIFNRCRFPPDQNYLFLGNYIDRGRLQIEVICLLMSFKVFYPESLFILRGNHECAAINRNYGFYDECKRRYSVTLYNSFQTLFNALPLCALVAGRIFCVHGGLSPKLESWAQLNAIKRPFYPQRGSVALDLLWADPEEWTSGWRENPKGMSYTFGKDVVKGFCVRMDIDLIARGHEVVQDGFEFFANRRLVTVFSAPKYCGEYNNNGAVMFVDELLVISFETVKPTLRDPLFRIRRPDRQKLRKSLKQPVDNSIIKKSE